MNESHPAEALNGTYEQHMGEHSGAAPLTADYWAGGNISAQGDGRGRGEAEAGREKGERKEMGMMMKRRR